MALENVLIIVQKIISILNFLKLFNLSQKIF